VLGKCAGDCCTENARSTGLAGSFADLEDSFARYAEVCERKEAFELDENTLLRVAEEAEKTFASLKRLPEWLREKESTKNAIQSIRTKDKIKDTSPLRDEVLLEAVKARYAKKSGVWSSIQKNVAGVVTSVSGMFAGGRSWEWLFKENSGEKSKIDWKQYAKVVADDIVATRQAVQRLQVQIQHPNVAQVLGKCAGELNSIVHHDGVGKLQKLFRDGGISWLEKKEKADREKAKKEREREAKEAKKEEKARMAASMPAKKENDETLEAVEEKEQEPEHEEAEETKEQQSDLIQYFSRETRDTLNKVITESDNLAKKNRLELEKEDRRLQNAFNNAVSQRTTAEKVRDNAPAKKKEDEAKAQEKKCELNTKMQERHEAINLRCILRLWGAATHAPRLWNAHHPAPRFLLRRALRQLVQAEREFPIGGMPRPMARVHSWLTVLILISLERYAAAQTQLGRVVALGKGNSLSRSFGSADALSKKYCEELEGLSRLDDDMISEASDMISDSLSQIVSEASAEPEAEKGGIGGWLKSWVGGHGQGKDEVKKIASQASLFSEKLIENLAESGIEWADHNGTNVCIIPTCTFYCMERCSVLFPLRLSVAALPKSLRTPCEPVSIPCEVVTKRCESLQELLLASSALF